MSDLGQKRRFERRRVTSGVPRSADHICAKPNFAIGPQD